jgi:nitroreductase
MRDTRYKINDKFKKRYSPKKFMDIKVENEDILSLIEAATTAPSCFNEQPWRFLVINSDEGLKKIKETLTEKNLEWNDDTKQFILLLSKKHFSKNGNENTYNKFDTGTAFGFMLLEALERNIQMHPMAGFDKVRTREIFQIEMETNIIALVAFGYGNNESFIPSNRNNFDEILSFQ